MQMTLSDIELYESLLARDEADRRNVLIQRTLDGALAIERLGDAIVARYRDLPL